MFSVLLPPHLDSQVSTFPALPATIRGIADPWRRSQLADDLAKQLRAAAKAVLKIRSEAIRELVVQHKTPHARVASHLQLSRARISQVVTSASGNADLKAVQQ